jgi:hypothetical protein
MVVELLVLEVFHPIAANNASLSQAFGQKPQAPLATRFFQLSRSGRAEALALDEEPTSAQENQALQGGPPMDRQGQRDEQHELRWEATEPINPRLNRVADLVDFVGKQADHLGAVGISQVARTEP